MRRITAPSGGGGSQNLRNFVNTYIQLQQLDQRQAQFEARQAMAEQRLALQQRRAAAQEQQFNLLQEEARNKRLRNANFQATYDEAFSDGTVDDKDILNIARYADTSTAANLLNSVSKQQQDVRNRQQFGDNMSNLVNVLNSRLDDDKQFSSEQLDTLANALTSGDATLRKGVLSQLSNNGGIDMNAINQEIAKMRALYPFKQAIRAEEDRLEQIREVNQEQGKTLEQGSFVVEGDNIKPNPATPTGKTFKDLSTRVPNTVMGSLISQVRGLMKTGDISSDDQVGFEITNPDGSVITLDEASIIEKTGSQGFFTKPELNLNRNFFNSGGKIRVIPLEEPPTNLRTQPLYPGMGL